MAFLIRPVTPRDADAWERLRKRLWDGHDHRREIARFFRGEASEPQEVLLALTEDHEVIAHIELSLRYDVKGLAGLRTGYVEGLYVEARNRASGIALKLLRAAESWAKDQGCLAFASDRKDRVIVHARYTRAPPTHPHKQRPLHGAA